LGKLNTQAYLFTFWVPANRNNRLKKEEPNPSSNATLKTHKKVHPHRTCCGLKFEFGVFLFFMASSRWQRLIEREVVKLKEC